MVRYYFGDQARKKEEASKIILAKQLKAKDISERKAIATAAKGGNIALNRDNFSGWFPSQTENKKIDQNASKQAQLVTENARIVAEQAATEAEQARIVAEQAATEAEQARVVAKQLEQTEIAAEKESRKLQVQMNASKSFDDSGFDRENRRTSTTSWAGRAKTNLTKKVEAEQARVVAKQLEQTEIAAEKESRKLQVQMNASKSFDDSGFDRENRRTSTTSWAGRAKTNLTKKVEAEQAAEDARIVAEQAIIEADRLAAIDKAATDALNASNAKRGQSGAFAAAAGGGKWAGRAKTNLAKKAETEQAAEDARIVAEQAIIEADRLKAATDALNASNALIAKRSQSGAFAAAAGGGKWAGRAKNAEAKKVEAKQATENARIVAEQAAIEAEQARIVAEQAATEAKNARVVAEQAAADQIVADAKRVVEEAEKEARKAKEESDKAEAEAKHKANLAKQAVDKAKMDKMNKTAQNAAKKAILDAKNAAEQAKIKENVAKHTTEAAKHAKNEAKHAKNEAKHAKEIVKHVKIKKQKKFNNLQLDRDIIYLEELLKF